MTVATNALLEGRVARTALLATEGFTDIEELGRQARAELYRLCASHPPPLVPAELRVPVPERTGPDGVLRELDEQALAGAARGARDRVRRGVPALGLPPPGPRAARGRARGARPSRRARVHLARDGGGVPRVRALRDHRGRRRPVAAAPRLPGAAGGALRAGRPPGARGDAVERRRRRRRHRGAARRLDRALGPGRRRRGGRPGGRGRRPRRCRGARHGRHLLRRVADARRRRRGGHGPRGGRPRAGAADGGRAHRRGGRRVDRVARRRRRSAGGSALGRGRTPGPLATDAAASCRR